MYTDLAIITLILVGIFYSGFPYEFEEIVSKRLKVGKFKLPKPFSCPLCMTWWTTLAYIIITGNLSLFNILVCLLFALSTGWIDSLYRLIFSVIETFIVWLTEILTGQ